jgi:lysophospholipase L1-like esterase
VRVYGLDIQKSGAAGVRIHKLGGTGSTAANWIAADETAWSAGLAALSPHIVSVLLGTNDQSSASEEVFRSRIQTLTARIRASVPAADILLVAPAENGLGRAIPMSQYARAMRQIASEYSCSFLDLQYSFGLAPADYASGSARPLFHSDQVHPNDLGGRAITAAIFRLIAP